MAQAAQIPTGRPRLCVDRAQLEFLRSLHFKWEDISCILGASVKTLQWRAKEWVIVTFTNLTDAQLDEMIRSYLRQFPQAGEAMIRGPLLSLNIHVQREKLRMSIQRLSGPGNSSHPAINCRSYSVPWPNALWHIDGDHKMIH